MTEQRRLSQIAAARGVWLLRWLLVLLIAFDQIGSPLHRHHHDSGVDAAHLTLVSTGDPSVSPHVPCARDAQESALFHSNTAVRSEARMLQCNEFAGIDANALVSLIWPELSETAFIALSRLGVSSEQSGPEPASWHELLPESRAPPPRA